MNGYDLSRIWFDFCFANPEIISPNHSALYFFAIEHCNRLGWKDKFGFPTEMAKDAIGIKSYNTYIKTLNDLVEWGFIKMIQRSKNQYSANIIALSKNVKAPDKALDKAIIKHKGKQGESTGESIDSINKPLTNKPINQEPINNTPNGVSGSTEPLSLIPRYSSIEKTKRGIYDFLLLRPTEVEAYVDFWNLFAKEKGLAQIKIVSDSRKRKLKVRIREKAFDLPAILGKAKDSPFLLQNKFFSFDWVIENDKNYLKVIEGNYDKPKPEENETGTEQQTGPDWRILEKIKGPTPAD